MTTRSLIEAWMMLVALSAATTLLMLIEATASDRRIIGYGVLMLAGFKARVILTRYLGLSRTQFCRRLFYAVLAIFLGLAYLIYVLG